MQMQMQKLESLRQLPQPRKQLGRQRLELLKQLPQPLPQMLRPLKQRPELLPHNKRYKRYKMQDLEMKYALHLYY